MSSSLLLSFVDTRPRYVYLLNLIIIIIYAAMLLLVPPPSPDRFHEGTAHAVDATTYHCRTHTHYGRVIMFVHPHACTRGGTSVDAGVAAKTGIVSSSGSGSCAQTMLTHRNSIALAFCGKLSARFACYCCLMSYMRDLSGVVYKIRR